MLLAGRHIWRLWSRKLSSGFWYGLCCSLGSLFEDPAAERFVEVGNGSNLLMRFW